MTNCKDVESQLIDYIDHNLSSNQYQTLSNHIDNCQYCKDSVLEFQKLFEVINYKTHDKPNSKAKERFNAMLLNETAAKSIKTNNISWSSFFKIAAILVLMITSYWIGNQQNTKLHQKELAVLKHDRNEFKSMITLSLFEDKSASKRIQAVNYAEELEQPKETILKALINEMLYDNLVNVRLAAANALERFSKQELVKEGFIKALKTEQNISMQIELIQILVHIKEKRAIPKIQDIINDTNTPHYLKEQFKTELQSLI